MAKKKTKEEFIKDAREKHKGKYDYSKVEYVNSKTNVCIICPEHGHGEFWQTPNSHLQGVGCPKCSGNYVPTMEEWISKACEIHGDKYNYSKVNYVNCMSKVCIICSEHGEFWQVPYSHLNGNGCPKCGGTCVLTKEEWIALANEKHNGKYDYSKVQYVNNKTKVCIICSEHGEFWQPPTNHLSGQGCFKCGIEKKAKNQALSTKEFIKKANKVHDGKYNYINVNYKDSKTKVCIICPEHGEFWQVPNVHLQGHGCPKCNLSHLERSMMNYLDNVEFTYESQKHFKWLGRQSLDFYLPDYNVGIECQGRQHFEAVDYFGGDKGFKNTLERDKRKKALCEKHGVKLLYFGNIPNYDTFLGGVVHNDVQYLIDYLEEHKIDRDKPTTE